MTNHEQSSEASLFGDVIYSYTRAQAIADGVLIDVSETAREAGFRWPVALTNAAWQDCVAWSEVDNEKQTYQDQIGRLWDVLTMARHAIKTQHAAGSELWFDVARIPRNGHATVPANATLKLVLGPGDIGEPIITILCSSED